MEDYEIIAEGTLTSTAASINITSIPATYTHLELFLNCRSTKSAASTAGGELRVNNNGSAIYATIGAYSLNSSTVNVLNSTGSNGSYTRNQIDNSHRIIADGLPANAYSTSKIVIPNYSNTTITSKGFLISSSTPNTNTSVWWQLVACGFVVQTAAINQIELFAESATYPFKAGTSYYLAGWK